MEQEEISGGWKREGGALGESRLRALEEGSRQQKNQRRAHGGGSIVHGKETSLPALLTSYGILGKSRGLSFPNTK